LGAGRELLYSPESTGFGRDMGVAQPQLDNVERSGWVRFGSHRDDLWDKEFLKTDKVALRRLEVLQNDSN